MTGPGGFTGWLLEQAGGADDVAGLALFARRDAGCWPGTAGREELATHLLERHADLEHLTGLLEAVTVAWHRYELTLEAGKPAGQQPARGYSWAPFQPGHELSTVHGAYSPRKVDPIASELVDGVLAQAAAPGSPIAYLADPTYRSALWGWGRAEAMSQLLTEYLMLAAEQTGDGVGDLEADRVKAAHTLLHRTETRASSLRSKLGLDPLSRSRMKRDVAAAQVDLAKLFADLDADDGDGGGPGAA